MTQLFANNVATYLAQALGPNTTDTVMYVVVDNNPGDLNIIDRFPDINSPQDYFLCTLENVETKEFEIVRATSINKSNGRMDVVRNQEQSGNKGFPIGSKVQIRVTKETLEGLRDYANTISSKVHNQQSTPPQDATSGLYYWQIPHTLARFPAVTVEVGTFPGGTFSKEADGVGEIEYIDLSTVRVYFTEPVLGRAILT